MRVSYGTRLSKPHRPRVMRGMPSSGLQGMTRSVDRRMCGPAIEPRKRLNLGCRHLSIGWQATDTGALLRASGSPGVVIEPGAYTSSLHGNREIFGLALARGSVSGRCQSRSR